MIRFFCIGLVLVSMTERVVAEAPATAATAPSAPSRLAVISTADMSDLAAMLTTELSGNPDITLVERDDLAKVGDELKLQQLAGNDAVALGKLIGADGLIFFSKGPNGLQVRFTAVGLGYALFDDQIASETDLPQLAKSIAHRVAGYAPKLKLDPAKAIPISVLNLRADYATPGSTTLERKLTLLLESRLASLPEYVVLERRHGWSLGVEHSLSANPKPILQGAYVVDGTLSLPLQDQRPEDVTIHLRLRSPNNQHSPLEIHGPISDLPGLVEKMTVEIQQATGTTSGAPSWQPEKEAREYLEEGIWGWQHGASDAALEALDSAELLGEKAPDLIPVRIAILEKRASVSLTLAKQDSSGPMPECIPVDQMIDDTLRAIADATRYDSEKMQARLQFLTWEYHMEVRTDQIKEDLSNFTSDLLVFLDARQSPRADELRQALRAVTGYDPLRGKLGRADMSHPLNVLTDSKDEWDLTVQEELARYHLLATTPHQFLPPDLLTSHGDGFCQRFLKTPEEQRKAYHQFVQELKDDPKGQLTYQLIMSCATDAAVADAAYTAYWKEMWNQREELVSQKVQVEEWTSARPVPATLRRKHASEMIPVLRYYLTHVNNYRDWEYSWDTFWQPDQWSEADAASIWADFLGFKQRAEADHLARKYGPIDLSAFEEPFQKRFSQYAIRNAPDRIPEFLVVKRLWHPWLMPGSPETRVYITNCQEAENALWLTAWFPGLEVPKTFLFKISLPDFKAELVDLPEMVNPGRLTADANALYVNYALPAKLAPSDPDRIARFDFKTQTWETRTIDFPHDHFFAVNGALYFDLKGGVGRYDWAAGKFTLLASSRRKPAQNQFDDCEDYAIASVFAGPGSKPCLTTDRGTYYIQDQPGNWPEVFDSSSWTQTTTGQGKTMVYCWNGEVVLLDPVRPEPEYLMSPTQPHHRRMAAIHQEFVKEMAPWAGQTQWDAVPDMNFENYPHYFGGNSHHLFLLLRPDDRVKSYELLWYDRDHGREPRVIPLQFILGEKNRAILSAMYHAKEGEKSELDYLEQPGQGANLAIIAAKDGICLMSDNVGVWFIPYGDIDGYLKTHTAAEPTSPPDIAMPTIPPPEDDAESQVIGDMIDPAIRATSFR